MNVNAGDLLKLLAGGVRPDGATQSAPVQGLDTKSFADLLADVKAGVLSSGRPVTVGPHADCELTDDQLQRLGVVADAAEAAGATRVAALIDGQLVKLDVLNRTVESAEPGGGGNVMTGIDGFVLVPQDAGAGMAQLFGGRTGAGVATDGQAPAGLGLIRNRSVAELLSGLSNASVGSVSG